MQANYYFLNSANKQLAKFMCEYAILLEFSIKINKFFNHEKILCCANNACVVQKLLIGSLLLTEIINMNYNL